MLFRHSATAHIPVILKRDPSLAEGNVVLRITFRENANFKTGYPEFSTYTLTVSDRRLNRMPGIWRLWIIISENMGRKSMN